MTAPETRVVCDPRLPIGSTEWIQQPIPWCTTHDAASPPNLMIGKHCPAGQIRYVTPDDCVISTGGPDHKWWRDQ